MKRICNICGKAMTEGYCVEGGLEYYCSDECLHKVYSPEEWDEMYTDDGDSYWTEWDIADIIEEEDTIFSIETDDWGDRIVHYLGFGYYGGGGDEDGKDHRFVEYTFCYVPLKEVLSKGFSAAEGEYAPEVKQYITDCTEEEMMDIYLHYDNGNCPTPITEITTDLPDGCYVYIG